MRTILPGYQLTMHIASAYSYSCCHLVATCVLFIDIPFCEDTTVPACLVPAN